MKIVKKLCLWFLCLVLLGMIGAACAGGAFLYWASRDLPELDRIADFSPPLASTVLARDGSVLGSLYHEKRYTIPLEKMSKHIPLAFLAAEDATFYQHDGINPVAIARAAIVNFQQGKNAQGGSTITQQVVKQLALSSERTYERKAKEAILSYRLEKHLTKDEILTIYLNQIFLGQQAYGVEAAARTFFGKHSADITLAESAVLAGLPKAPSSYNPFRNPAAAKDRQTYVLGRLLAQGWITKDEHDKALAEPLVYWTMPEDQGRSSSWYLEEVRRLLIEFFTEQNLRALGVETTKSGEDFVYEAGLIVRTAMEPYHQTTAEAALRRGLEELDKRQGWRGSLKKLAPEEIAPFLDKLKFNPLNLSGDHWVQAVVSKVTKQDIQVDLGNNFHGAIDLKALAWARTPKAPLPGAGDVIWVSATPTVTTVAAKKKTADAAPSQDDEPKTVITPLDVTDWPVKKSIPLTLQQLPDVQGALVSIEPDTGDVVALVGGYQFGKTHFNRATQARRQPGSSFKPVVYSAALDKGFTASSMLFDAPYSYVNPYTKEVWRPSNYGKSYKGALPLHRALALSLNTCTVRVAEQIGIATVNQRAKILGLEPRFPNELAVSLGAVAVTPLNMTQAYTAFANKGLGVRPRLITSIEDSSGRVLYQQRVEHWQAISPQNAFIMSTLLKNVVENGTAKRARIPGRAIAGKTGTTNEEKDTWFVGFSPHLVTGVYVGFDQIRPLGRGEAGGRTSAPIFTYYRKEVEDLYPAEDFEMPAGISISNGLAYVDTEPTEGLSAMDGNFNWSASLPDNSDPFDDLNTGDTLPVVTASPERAPVSTSTATRIPTGSAPTIGARTPDGARPIIRPAAPLKPVAIPTTATRPVTAAPPVYKPPRDTTRDAEDLLRQAF